MCLADSLLAGMGCGKIRTGHECMYASSWCCGDVVYASVTWWVMLGCAVLQVGVMRDNGLQTSRNLRRLLDRQLAADSKATATNKAQHIKQQQGKQQTTAAAVQLPSSDTTVRYMPRLSEECYQLALLARLPQSERSSDFAAAAYSLLETSLGRVQVATGLQMLQQDSITGQAAVSLTGGCSGKTNCSDVVVLCLDFVQQSVK